MTSSTRRSGLLTTAVVALIATLAGGGMAFAGSQAFTDVPPSNPFYDEIEAINTAGITTGFPDGTYRPNQNVTRGAMAAFMGRGFGRIAEGTSVHTNPPPADDVLTSGASTQMTGGSSGANTGGYVLVIGNASFEAPVAQCPCSLVGRVRDTTGGLQGGTRYAVAGNAVPNAETTIGGSWTAIERMELDEGQTHTYDVQFDFATNGASNTAVIVQTHIAVIYVPFDGTGNVAP